MFFVLTQTHSYSFIFKQLLFVWSCWVSFIGVLHGAFFSLQYLFIYVIHNFWGEISVRGLCARGGSRALRLGSCLAVALEDLFLGVFYWRRLRGPPRGLCFLTSGTGTPDFSLSLFIFTNFSQLFLTSSLFFRCAGSPSLVYCTASYTVNYYILICYRNLISQLLSTLVISNSLIYLSAVLGLLHWCTAQHFLQLHYYISMCL
jgi:hypothetical protein